MDVKVSTQNYDIIDAGCVIVQIGEYLEFAIANLKFRFVFVEDDNAQDEGGRIETRIENPGNPGESYMGIYVHNQKNAFFSSTPNLLSLATLDNKALLLKFAIQSINERDGNSDKVLFYTWYLTKSENSQTIVSNNIPQ